MQELQTIQKYLEKLEIEPETTSVYIESTRLGPSSALQLSKTIRISRTQIYRHLEDLQAKGLVSAEELIYGTMFRTLPLSNIEGLIANKEAETAALKRNLSAMTQVLQQLAGTTGPKATVKHYYGIGGLKQVNWNLTKAKGEYRVFEQKHLSAHLDKAFARRCREAFVENKLITYDLTNDDFVHAKDIEPFDAERSSYRYINPKILTINFEMYIYNDLVTLIDYSPEQPMAIEIHHPALHSMMKQLFDSMWQIAKPLKIQS